MRVVGFVVVALSLIGTLFAFSAADNYRAGYPRVYSLQSATLRSRPCPDPLEGAHARIPRDCPQSSLNYLKERYMLPDGSLGTTLGPPPRYTPFFSGGITLGDAVTATFAVALVGVGLLIFGARK